VNAASKPTTANALLIKTSTIKVGDKSTVVLTNQDGLTLYYFTQDTAQKVACTGTCTKTWHPVLFMGNGKVPFSGKLPGMLSTAKNVNGNQVLYNNHLLYTYSGDTAPGQAKGQGIANRWFVVTPDIAKNMNT
jgi:predicted lipoprotein with Yx(FWY)xxD motif